MLHLTLIFTFMAATIFLSMGCDRDRIKEFGDLKLGDPAPYKPGDSTSGPYRKIPQAKFYVYPMENGLPTMCVFEECGPHGEFIECLGGWLSGSDLEEMSDLVGLDEMDITAIIVVANQDSKIVGIYPYHTMQNLPEILKRHVDLLDFGSFAVKCPRGDQTVCCGCGHE
ncbi:hypothetical protein WDW89_12905 [Deltaproteobacteria bacterium TL4]